ncbi:hypothetical protein EZH22_12050 [Xanthobacter dioxanivorans]|uniref:Uncharacterized protein n=1 Tax=Xanthobacter dioxanivorans TaxID=2528964 RepID=A0A974SKK5_9HYPH|nr:hypothetical protein [Xanthobacter dioxanivorans]QRG08935.1 hypothetical protein EZH22_12050 [Xanthobacter dioxanivorans]
MRDAGNATLLCEPKSGSQFSSGEWQPTLPGKGIKAGRPLLPVFARRAAMPVFCC